MKMQTDSEIIRKKILPKSFVFLWSGSPLTKKDNKTRLYRLVNNGSLSRDRGLSKFLLNHFKGINQKLI